MIPEQEVLTRMAALKAGKQNPQAIADTLNKEKLFPNRIKEWTKKAVGNYWHRHKGNLEVKGPAPTAKPDIKTSNSDHFTLDRAEAERYLKMLDSSTDTFHFAGFHDDSTKKRTMPGQNYYDTLDAVWPKLVELNRKGYGIFVTVNKTNGKGRKASDIVAARALWIDDDSGKAKLSDDGTFIPSRGKLPLRPSMVVESSPGNYHGYWITQTDNLDEWQPVQKNMVEYGCDPGATDSARVLRLPGFCHQKINKAKGQTRERFTVRVVYQADDVVFDWSELKAAFKPSDITPCSDKPPDTATDDLDSAYANTVDMPALTAAVEYLKDKDHFEARNNWINTGLALKTAGEDAYKLWLSISDDEEEAEEKWSGFNPAQTGWRSILKKAQKLGWKNPGTSRGAGDWAKPEPLPDNLREVQPFRYELLPDSLADYVKDTAERMQCSPDYVAVPLMVSLASVIGRKVGIRPKQLDEGFMVIPNLWGLLIGRPSAKKSPAMGAAVECLNTLESEAEKEYLKELAQFQLQFDFNKIEGDDAKAKAKKALSKDGADREEVFESYKQRVEDVPTEPTRKRFTVNDSTVEKLGEILSENPNGVLLQRDELSGWLKGLDSEDHANDKAFYLEGFNGTGGYTYDRIGRGTLRIDAVTLSIIGTTQPGKLIPYLSSAIRQNVGDDGFIQRFQLAVYPDPVDGWKYTDRARGEEYRAKVFEVFQHLALLPALPPLKDDTVRYIHFSEVAQPLFVDWYTKLEYTTRAQDIHPAIEAHLSKYASLIPSLALIIQLVEVCKDVEPLALADKLTVDKLTVDKGALQKAIAWGSYLESHARRLYGMAVDNDITNARTLLDKIKADKLDDPIKSRAIQRKGWAGLSDRETIARGLSMLEDYGWIRSETDNATGGRPSTAYRIHPMLKK